MLSTFLPQILSPRPLFEGPTFGHQGLLLRHIYMAATVSLLKREPAVGQGAFSILEIGSWTGSSVLTWAQAIDTFHPSAEVSQPAGVIHCVDPWDAYISQSDISSSDEVYRSMDLAAKSGLAYELFLHNVKFVPSSITVTHSRARARDILPYFRPASFDIVYVDGSHYYADVCSDLLLGKPLVKDGGILCGDDLELPMKVVDERHARENLDKDYIQDPLTKQHFHPGVTLAIGENLGDVSSFDGYWLARRRSHRFEPVSLEGLPTIVPNHFPEKLKQEIRSRFEGK